MQKRIIWIGLDVHAASIALARFDEGATNPITSELSNERKLIERTFKKLAAEGELRVCYEAGPCGYEVCRQLRAMGIDCVVIAPSLIPSKPGDRVKTDRRDAVKLARLYRAGELTAVWVPSEDDEAARDVLRTREDARHARTAARHRLQKFLLRHGRRLAKKGWTQTYWRWVLAQKFERDNEKLVFEHYVQHVQFLDAQIKHLDEHIAALATSEPFRARVEKLCCLCGIGTLTAMVILAELGDLRRFDHPRQLMSYLGIVPSEHSSGNKQQRGRITKTGNSHVRRVLIEAAWAYRHGGRLTAHKQRALAKQPPAVAHIVHTASARLGRRYRKLVGRGKKPNVAVVANARELCGFIWAIEASAIAA